MRQECQIGKNGYQPFRQEKKPHIQHDGKPDRHEHRANHQRKQETCSLALGKRRAEAGNREINRPQQQRAEITADNRTRIRTPEVKCRQRHGNGQQQRNQKQGHARKELSERQFP